MNFSPFGGHFPASIPPIHQFATKFTHEPATGGEGGNNGSTTVNGVSSLSDEGGMVGSPPPNRYPVHYSSTATSTTTSIPVVKYQRDSSTQVSGNMIPVSSPNPTKYASTETVHHYDPYSHHHAQQPKRPSSYHSDNLQDMSSNSNNVKQEDKEDAAQQQQQPQQQQNGEYSAIIQQPQQQPPGMPPTWQSIATPGSTVADYLSHLPASTLPLSLHHFLKYSAESIKKDAETTIDQPLPHHQPLGPGPTSPAKKKKKKKVNKEKKPRPKPGEIRLTTALDGSTLYCCPECHMAYPDKSLLEQHLLGHTMERRFFCDICGAGLKRKDHLTRHKQSHNPDRPFVCTVCMKAFKRKEQLTLHFVIHSGEKRHVCPECGKGFYRKDHLRKHTRSHIARRVKAELSQHVPASNQADRDPMS